MRYGSVNGSGTDIIGGSNDEGPPAAAPPLPLLPSWIKVEVDARAYMSKLWQEVRRLHDELEATRLAREEEVHRDLLAYIRPLPKEELQRLTGTMSPKVLEAMKGLVLAVLSGIGKGGGVGEEEEKDGGGKGGNDNDNGSRRGARGGVRDGRIIRPDTMMEQIGKALAQLCMWQLWSGTTCGIWRCARSSAP